MVIGVTALPGSECYYAKNGAQGQETPAPISGDQCRLAPWQKDDREVSPCSRRIDSLSGALQQKGINRRRFLKFCSLMTATLALPPRYVAQVAAALGKARKPVLVWLQFQDCAGNSESILRSSHPTVLEWY